MEIKYFGHSSFIVSVNEHEVGIDPWLKGNPLCPPAYYDSKVDIIALTHGHGDHAGDVVRIAKLHNASVAATYELACLLKEDGIDDSKIISMNTGGSTSIAGITVALTPAIHSSSYTNASGTVCYAGQPNGVILRFGDKTLYHAGDTALFSDMKLIGERWRPDIAMLPIGDHYTMGVEEAARAASILNVKRVIPIHHSTFPLLTGTPDQFHQECKRYDVEVTILKPGESTEI